LILTSYLQSENNTDLINLFYGAFENNVGGSRGRWRVDLVRGTNSVGVGPFSFYDTHGRYVPTQSGFNMFFNLGFDPILWGNQNSPWDACAGLTRNCRQRVQSLGYVNVAPTYQLTVTNQQVLFTFLNIITVFLSVISSSTALIHIIVGPGEYDPKGLLNKFFFFDVPVLRDAASDIKLKNEDDGKKRRKHKKKRAAGSVGGGADGARGEGDHRASSGNVGQDDLHDEGLEIEMVAVAVAH